MDNIILIGNGVVNDKTLNRTGNTNQILFSDIDRIVDEKLKSATFLIYKDAYGREPYTMKHMVNIPFPEVKSIDLIMSGYVNEVTDPEDVSDVISSFFNNIK